MSEEPVDGFTVERVGDTVLMILTSRYGDGDQYELPVEDARRIAESLLIVISDWDSSDDGVP
jgi:hypothetical protein